MINKLFQLKLKMIKAKCERQKAKQELRAKYAEYYPQKVGAKVSNVMLTIIVAMIVGYVVADFILQYHTGMEISSTITTCWFVFWGTEVAALAGIKVSKIFKESGSKKLDDNETVG